MKTLQLKEPVNHKDFGNGKIEAVREGGAMYKVDFNGTLRTCRVSELERVKSNQYTPKPTVTNVLAEVQKLQIMVQERIRETDPRQSEFAKGCNAYARMIDEHLENILQGKK